MQRRLARPYGSSIPATRLLSLIMALAVLWMLYERMRDPGTWRWLADGQEAAAPAVPAAPQPAPAQPEHVVEGPNDLDPAELADFREKEELITDNSDLRPREMFLYWQLMGWSRTQPFTELEQRAVTEPYFMDFFEQPQKQRGKPIKLRMHVRQVIPWNDVPQNPAGVKEVFEIRGATDRSQTFPYVVIVPDRPAGLPVGDNVRAEIVFVGYFLKSMKYQDALATTRRAPLLIGRLRLVPAPAPAKPVGQDPWTIVLLVGVGIAMIVSIYGWSVLGARRRPPASPLPTNLSELGPFGGDAVDAPFPPIQLPSSPSAAAPANPFSVDVNPTTPPAGADPSKDVP